MADKPTHLAIKDWQKHQHYKDRRPPWIKLYGALLDDPTFLELPEVAQAQLIKLWLLASRMGHPLPYDARMLAGKIAAYRPYLDALIASGFLQPCYHGRENVLAEVEQNVRPLSTENREQRTETDSSGDEKWRPIEESRLAERLTTDAGRNALASILRPAERRLDIVYALHAMLDGLHPPIIPPSVMDRALVEYAASGQSSGTFNTKHFRGFIRDVAAPERPPRQGNPGAQQVANIIGGSHAD